jgi:hypothetical protein
VDEAAASDVQAPSGAVVSKQYNGIVAAVAISRPALQLRVSEKKQEQEK